MKVVAFVPLKLQNERLPGKNTKPFGDGRPLVCHILDTLCAVDALDEIYVYCSDHSVESLLPGGVAFLERSTGLDQSSTRINEVMSAFGADIDADVYVLAHATAPFLRAASIALGVEQVVAGGHDSAMTVTRHQDFVWFEGVPLNYDPTQIPRTQDLTPAFIETTGLYVYRRELIIEHGRRTGDDPYLIEVSRIEAMDINEPIDFIVAEAVFDVRASVEPVSSEEP